MSTQVLGRESLDPRNTRRLVRLVVLVMSLIILVSTSTAAPALDVETPGAALRRTTVVTASESASLPVSVPTVIDAARGDIPWQSLGGGEVVAEPAENFVALILSSSDQRSGTTLDDLPRLVAVQLPFPEGPRIAFSLQGEVDNVRARQLPPGSYRLTVLTRGPVAVTLTLPSLPDGTVSLVPSTPATYQVRQDLQEPTPAGVHGPSFTGGFDVVAAQNHQVFKYLWAVGDLKAVDEQVLCDSYGPTRSALGLYVPNCGDGGSGAGFNEVGARTDYVALLWGWDPARSPRAYSVGGHWTVAGQVNGGGVLYLWLDE